MSENTSRASMIENQFSKRKSALPSESKNRGSIASTIRLSELPAINEKSENDSKEYRPSLTNPQKRQSECSENTPSVFNTIQYKSPYENAVPKLIIILILLSLSAVWILKSRSSAPNNDLPGQPSNEHVLISNNNR